MIERYDFDHVQQFSLLEREEAILLYNEAKNVRKGCIVEIGNFEGGSTICLAWGSQDGNHVPIYSFDPHDFSVYEKPEQPDYLQGLEGPRIRAEYYSKILNQGLFDVVRPMEIRSELVASGDWKCPVSLLFVDGNHEYSAVKKDIEVWKSNLRNGARILMDDCAGKHYMKGPARVSAEMEKSSEFSKIKTVSGIDVFEFTPK